MHRVTSRVLAGPELCRSEGYLKTSQTFTDSIMINALVLTSIPMGVFRELGCYLITYFHRRNLTAAMKYVLPVAQQRLEDHRAKDLGQRPADAMEWTIELQEATAGGADAGKVALDVLHNLWAGSAAPGGLVAQMITQVLMEPNYLAPLRSEAQAAVSAHGWTDRALNSMVLADSFIRELGRLYPTGSVGSARTVVGEPFRFHDGRERPLGTRLGFPSLAYMRDSNLFNDPLKFDGFRFARLEEQERKLADEAERRWAATTITKANLA